MLCSIKRPLKIHFPFGNNNGISVSIPGSGVRLALFCSRVFCHLLMEMKRSLIFFGCQVNIVSNATVSNARDNVSEEPEHGISPLCSLIPLFFHLAWHFRCRHYWNISFVFISVTVTCKFFILSSFVLYGLVFVSLFTCLKDWAYSPVSKTGDRLFHFLSVMENGACYRPNECILWKTLETRQITWVLWVLNGFHSRGRKWFYLYNKRGR